MPERAAMADVVIRKMREDDRANAMRILDHWNMAPRSPTPKVPNPERSALCVEHAFVATHDNVPIGVASYILHEKGFAETASLAVDPAWVGAGLGELLQHARLAEMKARGVERVRSEADRSNVVQWYVRKFGYRIVGSVPKRHEFGCPGIDHWTVLELDLRTWTAVGRSDHREEALIAAAIRTHAQ
jgi:GNAT superfamily N-acetyltransferase